MSQPDVLAFYKDEVHNEEQSARLYAIARCHVIAWTIGVKKTVDELLPFLHELSKQTSFLNDDEFLFRLAEQYMILLDYVGGNHACMIGQVEWLAYQEETVIRDKAVEVLGAICSRNKVNVSEEIIPVLHRLAAAEWFTARLSVCALFQHAYPKATDSQKLELRKLYAHLSGDETPMVRRAAALKLKDFAAVVDKAHISQELLPVYRQLAQDDTQDIIRVACVHTSLVLIENHFRENPEDNKAHTLMVLTNATEDRSWRVRLTVTQNFNRICNALGPEMTGAFLLNPFVQLLKDSEQEVRSASITSIAKLCQDQCISNEQLQNFIVPQFSALGMDSSQMVRTALASTISVVATSLGKELTQRLLLNTISDMMKDEHHDVRLHIVSHAAEICGVLGLDVIAHSLLSTIQSLVMDNQWRIRKSVLEQIPELARQFGAELFQTKLEAIFFNSLGDSVYAVRFAAVENVGIICSHFGHDWTTSHFLPKITEQYQTNSGFSTRTTILHALPQLAKVMKPEQVQSLLVPLLLKGLQDVVPNVRYCACRLAPQVCQNIAHSFIKSTVLPALEGLTGDGDPDVSALANDGVVGLKAICGGH